MSDAWVGIAKTTIPEHLREVEPAAIRRRIIPAMLDQAGKISFNHSGTKMDWRVTKTRAGITPYEDLVQLAFPRMNRHEVPELDWRAYVAGEMYSLLDELKNKGEPAIAKWVGSLDQTLMKDAFEAFHGEIYKDGNAAGNTSRFHGIESFFSTTGAAASGNARVLVNNDTYAGLATAPGNYGGTWDASSGNSIWPDGSGDIEYEFWSPLVIDYQASAFGGTTWRANCLAVMRYAISSRLRNVVEMGKNLFFLLDRTMYREFQEEVALKERIHVMPNAGDSNLISLGFQAYRFEGVDVTTEYGIPQSSAAVTQVGYLFDANEAELRSLQDGVWKAFGPDWSIDRLCYRIALACAGNYKFNPPAFTKLTTVN